MIGLIIFGTKAVSSTVTTGTFTCPRCSVERPFQHMRMRRYFTLYWIPLIPLGILAEYLECLACHGHFEPKLLGPT